ncbi:N-acetylmuramoyl-L-alanine amidase [Candidatus Trichorickettsia mobilis]|uniref:N-acetylmuramoyl-L-alanine amidase n=1 Tax=Candidatus Trichorickettsia mobilis TaxID=1346319 RepID=A0ABZ0USM3_9RICK|nr:N-acetylmuramoyl-L-alanine amidase [Candidatus Trichorickettsia mobilis]WPY01022.1 N-acetylmuramoyl-L-alanine amidase [Candidatus Trichorickettsia mobilis]
MNIITKFCSPNYSIRKGEIKFIIIHYTEMEFDEAISKLCNIAAKVSAHYVIKADGEVFRLVEDQHSAWHAGVSNWQNYSSINEYSVGIELDNLGYASYPIAQMQSCISLCKQLITLYNIPRTNILGHSDIAPNRKIDPGPFFDWSYLGQHKLGLWYRMPLNLSTQDTFVVDIMFSFGDKSDEVTKLQQDLQRIGYKIEITGTFDLQTNYVIRAFQSHFYPQLIIKLGKDLYHNNNYQYSWDEVSHEILQSIKLNYYI